MDVCRIFKRTKRQIYRYRQQGLADYGGRPVMFDPNEVAKFIYGRRKERLNAAAIAKIATNKETNRIAEKLLRRFKRKA